MKLKIAVILCLVSLTGVLAFAQTRTTPATPATATKAPAASTSAAAKSADTNLQILIDKVKADKKLLVAANMNLTDAEAKSFWPLYESYQKDLAKLNERIESLAKTYISADAKGPISDQLAKKLIADQLEIERAELDAKKAMLAKAGKILPAWKAAKYGQMENKMRALVKYELAINIPLIE